MVTVKDAGSIWVFRCSELSERDWIKQNVEMPSWGWIDAMVFVQSSGCIELVERLRTEAGMTVVDYDSQKTTDEVK